MVTALAEPVRGGGWEGVGEGYTYMPVKIQYDKFISRKAGGAMKAHRRTSVRSGGGSHGIMPAKEGERQEKRKNATRSERKAEEKTNAYDG